MRQRVQELQQKNQILSASLQLGAAAAAVHLKQRQPRTNLDDGNMDYLLKDSVDLIALDYQQYNRHQSTSIDHVSCTINSVQNVTPSIIDVVSVGNYNSLSFAGNENYRQQEKQQLTCVLPPIHTQTTSNSTQNVLINPTELPTSITAVEPYTNSSDVFSNFAVNAPAFGNSSLSSTAANSAIVVINSSFIQSPVCTTSSCSLDNTPHSSTTDLPDRHHHHHQVVCSVGGMEPNDRRIS